MSICFRTPTWAGRQVFLLQFAIITPSGHAPFACSEMEMCMCLKKEALLDFIQSMICTICFLVVFSDQHTVYVFHVKTKKKKRKEGGACWNTVTSQSCQAGNKFWSNWVLRCLIWYWLCHSHFNCTHRFDINMRPWIKRYDYKSAWCRCVMIVLFLRLS